MVAGKTGGVPELNRTTSTFWTPAPNVNSINWLLGHIVSTRTTGLRALGQAPVWDDNVRARYRAGSSPITCEEEGVLDLIRLLFDFAESQRRIEAGLATVTADELSAPSSFEQFATVGDQLLWGAAEPLRRMLRILLER